MPHTAYSDDYINATFKLDDNDGRGKYCKSPLNSPNVGTFFTYKGHKPPKRGWRHSLETMQALDNDNRLVFPSTPNGRLMKKRYLNEAKGMPVGNLWNDINFIANHHNESTGYPTQKPLKLLERIIKASSNEGDLVLDCFLGSGTTAVACKRLGRRFVGVDCNSKAIEIAEKRLANLPA